MCDESLIGKLPAHACEELLLICQVGFQFATLLVDVHEICKRHAHLHRAHDEGCGCSFRCTFLDIYIQRDLDEGTITEKEAQELIQMSQSAMSRLIQRLEGLDPSLVTRCTCDLDKRGIYVQLTDAGHEVYSRIAEACRDILVEDDNK